LSSKSINIVIEKLDTHNQDLSVWDGAAGNPALFNRCQDFNGMGADKLLPRRYRTNALLGLEVLIAAHTVRNAAPRLHADIGRAGLCPKQEVFPIGEVYPNGLPAVTMA